MDKRKDTGVCVGELCERFRNRGIAEKAQSDADENRSREERVRRANPNAYVDSASSHSPEKFKTGNDGGGTYMTSDDFLRYYQKLREPKAPEGVTRSEEEYDKAQQKDEVKAQSKKERRLAIRKLIAQKLKGLIDRVKRPRESVLELIEQTNKGFPEDKPENRANARAKKVPRGVLPLIACVIASLFLIVCSSVMVSRAKSDVARLEVRIQELEEIRERLESELDTKNDMINIHDIATNQYGMVGIEYVESKYIYIEREDKIELAGKRSMSAAVELLRSFEVKNGSVN